MNPAALQFRCPHCARTLEVEVSLAGQEVECPDCNQRLVVPSPEETLVGAESEAQGSLLRPGEGSLACGLALLGVAGYLAPQVMLGLLALLLAPVVLALLLIGAWRACDPDLPWGRQTIGLLLLLLALGGLLMTTGWAMDTSARAARLTQIREDRMRAVQSAHPSVHAEDPGAAALRMQIESELERLSRHPAHAPRERPALVGTALWLAPVFMGLGLYCRAGWSPWHCTFWAGVVWVFPYGMARLVQSFGSRMVLSA